MQLLVQETKYRMWLSGLIVSLLLIGVAAGCGAGKGTPEISKEQVAPASKTQQPAGSERQPTANGTAQKPAADQAAPVKKEPPTKVVLAIPRKSFGYLPLYVGLTKGYFKDEGLELEVMEMKSNASIAALIAGEILLGGGGSSAMRAAVQGAPLKIFLFTYEKMTSTLVGGKQIKTIPELKGKVVGVNERGGTLEVAAKKMLEMGGLDPEKDITFMAVGSGNNAVAAMQGGSIHAMLLNSDIAGTLFKDGFTNLGFGGDVMPTPFSGFATTDKALQEQRELIKRWTRAYLKSIMFTRDNQTEVTQISIKEFALDPDVAKAAVSETAKAIGKGIPGGATKEGLAELIETDVREAMKLEGAIPQEKMIDFSLLAEVQKEFKQ